MGCDGSQTGAFSVYRATQISGQCAVSLVLGGILTAAKKRLILFAGTEICACKYGFNKRHSYWRLKFV